MTERYDEVGRPRPPICGGELYGVLDPRISND